MHILRLQRKLFASPLAHTDVDTGHASTPADCSRLAWSIKSLGAGEPGTSRQDIDFLFSPHLQTAPKHWVPLGETRLALKTHCVYLALHKNTTKEYTIGICRKTFKLFSIPLDVSSFKGGI